MIVAGDTIDRLISAEVRRPGNRRGFKWELYRIARAKVAEPMVLAAARMLDRPPCRVAIASGAAVPEHMPKGENDGPFGSAVLAKALAALGHQTAVITDAACADAFRFLLDRYELDTAVQTVALRDDAEQEAIAGACDALVAIERLGGNINGHLHGVTGVSRDSHRANLDHLFRTARALGKPTLAIGDGGNEIGFGNVFKELSEGWPDHAMADTTPCGGGIYSVVETDLLVTAATSNLGAYGVVAGLALLRGEVSLCHTAEEERCLHNIALGLGLADGSTGRVIPWCDGVPAESSAAIVQIMSDIVAQTAMPPMARRF